MNGQERADYLIRECNRFKLSRSKPFWFAITLALSKVASRF